MWQSIPQAAALTSSPVSFNGNRWSNLTFCDRRFTKLTTNVKNFCYFIKKQWWNTRQIGVLLNTLAKIWIKPQTPFSLHASNSFLCHRTAELAYLPEATILITLKNLWAMTEHPLNLSSVCLFIFLSSIEKSHKILFDTKAPFSIMTPDYYPILRLYLLSPCFF